MTKKSQLKNQLALFIYSIIPIRQIQIYRGVFEVISQEKLSQLC